MKYLLYIAIMALPILFASNTTTVQEPDNFQMTEDTPVWQVLEKLGEPMPNHVVNTSIKGVSVERGRELVMYGITTKTNGRKVKKQSKHFVCTSCHNVEREDPDLTKSDPEKRLKYVAEKGLPFLQGTTFWGAVNRTSFYNGDYDKKYGDLVLPARNNLREAIKLCAVECAQGRTLKDWELESVLAYLWSLELKMGDLNIPAQELNNIGKVVASNKKENRLANYIKKQYLSASPAHFIDAPADRKNVPLIGDPINGELVYQMSCQHCHANSRYSFFELDNGITTFKFLDKHASDYTRYSIYQVARYGTSPMNGKRAYMPLYPLEKMSKQQMADLRAYIKLQSS